jgi:PBP1b-binding outer membrane lipoprotein LpoB
MSKLSISILFITLFLGISGCSNQTEPMQTNKQVVEQTPSDFKPAFTKETVIKLNAIVSLQLEVINEYDAIIAMDKKASMTAEKKHKLMQSNSKIIELSTRSKINLNKMMAAEKQLKESGEEYNKATFAGMMDFMKDVEREISAKAKR